MASVLATTQLWSWVSFCWAGHFLPNKIIRILSPARGCLPIRMRKRKTFQSHKCCKVAHRKEQHPICIHPNRANRHLPFFSATASLPLRTSIKGTSVYATRSQAAAAAPLLCAISTPCFVYYQIATTHQGCGRDAVFNLRFEFLLEFLGCVERGVFFSCVNHQDGILFFGMIWWRGRYCGKKHTHLLCSWILSQITLMTSFCWC